MSLRNARHDSGEAPAGRKIIRPHDALSGIRLTHGQASATMAPGDADLPFYELPNIAASTSHPNVALVMLNSVSLEKRDKFVLK